MLCRTSVNSRPVQRHLISWAVPFLMLDWDGLFPVGCRNASAQTAAEFNQQVNVGMRWEPLISSAQAWRTTQVIHWSEKSFSPAQLGVFESEQVQDLCVPWIKGFFILMFWLAAALQLEVVSQCLTGDGSHFCSRREKVFRLYKSSWTEPG